MPEAHSSRAHNISHFPPLGDSGRPKFTFSAAPATFTAPTVKGSRTPPQRASVGLTRRTVEPSPPAGSWGVAHRNRPSASGASTGSSSRPPRNTGSAFGSPRQHGPSASVMADREEKIAQLKVTRHPLLNGRGEEITSKSNRELRSCKRPFR